MVDAKFDVEFVIRYLKRFAEGAAKDSLLLHSIFTNNLPKHSLKSLASEYLELRKGAR